MSGNLHVPHNSSYCKNNNHLRQNNDNTLLHPGSFLIADYPSHEPKTWPQIAILDCDRPFYLHDQTFKVAGCKINPAFDISAIL